MLAISMLFLFWNYTINAQDITIKRTHPIAEIQPGINANLNATGTLNVVAIMVEFKPDTNRLTSGTGIFGSDGSEGLPYLQRAEDVRIEPLPHNRRYFESHLEFAKNYYEKASDGLLTIDYQVLPEIYQLPKKMEEYSPTGETFTNEKISQLVKDAWNEVANGSNFDASGLDPENTAFIIFHAGIGRDIELTGTNLDITPFDIPSLYLTKKNLANLLDEPQFDGFEVNDGAFRVTNSMVIPRTQSRRGLDIQQNEFVFPLSINGLLIASIGSHLGLPDLFNTETGDPAIGRFGLMDGAGFFAYNGLLPPEPSAWEKIYLGWETPFTISASTPDSIPLPATSLDQPNSIAKYSLSSSEYFLIENRHRDTDGNGVTITIRKPDGIEVEQTFTNEDEDFVFQQAGFDSLLEAGTFIDVTNFDFSLPGGIDIGEDENDPADDRELNGGILIWHIDEAIINEQLQSGRVNADPQRRGIDLEEADGAQDIGAALAGALDNSVAFGIAFDFWWKNNDYRVILESGREISFYENRFAPDTRPNNDSNTGSPSFFELFDFSDNQPTAYFKIRSFEAEESIYSPLFSLTDTTGIRYTPQDDYWDHFPLSMGVHVSETDTFLVIPGQNRIHVYDHLNPELYSNFRNVGAIQQPILNDQFIIGTKPELNNGTTTGQIDITSIEITHQPFIIDDWQVSAASNNAFLSSQDGDSLFLDFTDSGFLTDNGAPFTNPSSFEFTSEKINGKYAGIKDQTITFIGEDIQDFTSSSQNRLFAGTIKTGSSPLYYIFEDRTFTLVDPSRQNPFIPIFEEAKAEWPAISKNLNIFRVNRSGNQLEGYNRNGASLVNLPIPAPSGIQFIGTPLLADITGDEVQDLIVVGQDEYSLNIFAYEKTGDPIDGFPLYVGEVEDQQLQPIHPVFFENKLYAVSHTYDVKAWEFQNFTSSEWPSRYGTNPFNKVSAIVNSTGSNGAEFSILNPVETYNWPNPATDHTYLRFELEEPGGTVEISIITMAGRLIYENTLTAAGGAPQELQINTSNWASGGYVARVKATVDGKSETKLIKIGVVK
ncbi:MAG: T9SS type A sorting domain-containing protein [Gracilimonas sp.]|nr:T9SS type A sorting domain-containing protein [Gracilimonas sp.]